jgi:hypothetical protein
MRTGIWQLDPATPPIESQARRLSAPQLCNETVNPSTKAQGENTKVSRVSCSAHEHFFSPSSGGPGAMTLHHRDLAQPCRYGPIKRARVRRPRWHGSV